VLEGTRRDSRQHLLTTHCLRRIGVTTALGGISTLRFAVLFASNWLAFRNAPRAWYLTP
jgi:hypothetical protein